MAEALSRLISNADCCVILVIRQRQAEGLRAWAWTWGAVGILENPAKSLEEEIRNPWRRHFKRATRDCELFETHARSERAVISEDSFLRMRWPTRVDSNSAVNLDLLMATSTAPTLAGGRYSTAREIGQKFAEQDYPTYFIENVARQIRTTQDLHIWKEMVRLRPDLAARYAIIASLQAGAASTCSLY